MKSPIYYTIMGIIQGITEFIPVSSSGHLVIAQNLFGLQKPQIFFDIILHLGTLMAVIIYFRNDILEIIRSLIKPKTEGFKLFLLIITGTIPIFVLGYLMKGYFKLLFTTPIYSSIFLIITGTILFLTKFIKTAPDHEKDIQKFSFKDAVIIGISQALAIAPGLSRSGVTISAGIFRKINRKLCTKYSLLLSIPAILGAVFSEITEVQAISFEQLIMLLIGFISSFISGYLAIIVLVKCLEKAKFYVFSYYCWLIGIFSLIYFLK